MCFMKQAPNTRAVIEEANMQEGTDSKATRRGDRDFSAQRHAISRTVSLTDSISTHSSVVPFPLSRDSSSPEYLASPCPDPTCQYKLNQTFPSSTAAKKGNLLCQSYCNSNLSLL